jgi:hypothetical protein
MRHLRDANTKGNEALDPHPTRGKLLITASCWFYTILESRVEHPERTWLS